MTVVRAAALGACVLALCACDSGAGRKGPTKVVARGSATGKHVSATASYDFTVLSDLSIHVEAVPAQRVTGGWVVSCTGPYSTRDSADFAGRTPLDVPVTVTSSQRVLTCEFIATATLTRSGRIRVLLRGRASS